MSESKKKTNVWIGIDWGDTLHFASAVTDDATLVSRVSVPNSPAGFASLREWMLEQGNVGGVAVESTRHILICFLSTLEYDVYHINPKMSAAWRKMESVSEAKSDERDGRALAEGIAYRHAKMEPKPPWDPRALRLSMLCEKECAFIEKRTALVQELKSLLKQYYPAALDVFRDWTAPAAWDFLLRYPTAKNLARATEQGLIAFLKGHKLGQTAHWRKVVEERGRAVDWPTHHTEEICVMQAEGIVAQLKAVHKTLKRFRAEIEADFEKLPEAKLLKSLPGAGDKLAPRLAAMLLSPVAQTGGLDALRCYAGVAPVLKQSGKRSSTLIRRLCDKRWRNTLHLFADCSKRCCKWARAFYLSCRGRGNSHSTALRKLADKWLKIITAMQRNGKPYDDEKYMQALRRKGSPLWEQIAEN